MKKTTQILSFLFFTFLLFHSIDAQTVTEENRSMSKGMQNALVLEIPNATAKIADKVWKKYVKDCKCKTKKDRKTNEWMSDDAKINSISANNRLDLYAQINEVGENVTLTAWFDLGGAYINSYDHADEYNAAHAFLANYSTQVAKEMTLIELEEEEKKLKELDTALKKLAKAKENYEREIENAKERIRVAEENIVNNLAEQSGTLQAIDNQETVIEEVKTKLTEF